MRKICFKSMLIASLGLFLMGCAGGQKPVAKEAPPPFQPVNLNTGLQSGQFKQKTNAFMVILDKSGSMNEMYSGHKKIQLAEELVSRMNQTLPNMPLTAGMETFGRMETFTSQYATSKTVYGPAAYSKDAFANGLAKVDCARGLSPLDSAINLAGENMQNVQGQISLIIVTDGVKEDMNYDAALAAAKKVKGQYGDRLCIYPIQIGKDKEGTVFLGKIAEAGGCGFAVNADEIWSNDGMAAFVTDAFLEKVVVVEKVEEVVVVRPAPGPNDTDGDGVTDDIDQCPNTPKGAVVDARGCWVLDKVYFDFDKSNIKPEFKPALDAVAGVLNNNPSVKMTISGNTDSIGTPEYNMGLSIRRAKSVKAYLVSKGVNADRISVIGYGEDRPADTNATAAGRAMNRRAVLLPMI
ncbi:OmpA family protein [bacterium]|nr:OmpA family protein [bacterium]